MNQGYKFENRQNELLQRIIQLGAERDLLNMSIRQFCEELGISIGAFYHYFKDKNDMLMQVLYTIEDFVREECEGKFEDSWRHNVGIVSKAFIEYNRRSGPQMVFLAQSPETASTDYGKSKDKYTLITVKAQFEKAIADGDISSRYTPDELTQLFFAVIRGIIYNWAKNGGQDDIYKMGRMAFDIFIAGITTK